MSIPKKYQYLLIPIPHLYLEVYEEYVQGNQVELSVKQKSEVQSECEKNVSDKSFWNIQKRFEHVELTR